MAISIQQAACNALGAHIYAKISPGVEVNYDWPDPESPLQQRAISVLLVGEPEDEYLQPTVIGSTTIDAVTNLYRWKVLERTQPIQLDVWSTYQCDRDDIIAQLDQLFMSGWGDTPDPGLVLSLGDGWDARAVFDFDGPSVTNSGALNQVSEFRGTYQGEFRVVLYVDAPSAKLAKVKLHMILNGTAMDSTLA